MGHDIPHLKELADVLGIINTPLPLYACVDALCRNPTGFQSLFVTMNPSLRTALTQTCEEMLDGTEEALTATLNGQNVEDWRRIRGGDGLALNEENLNELQSRITALQRLLENLNET